MSFEGPYPYGTDGGNEDLLLPLSPPLVRIAKGRSYILVLQVNGPLTTRLRENVEDVVRVLGLQGQTIVGVIIRDNAVIADANATDLDFQEGIEVEQVAQGTVLIRIPSAAITANMLINAIVNADKLADLAVTTGKIANLAVTNGKIADNAITTAKIQDNAVTTFKIAPGAVDTAAIGNDQVTYTKIAPDVIDSSKIIAGSILQSDLGFPIVDPAIYKPAGTETLAVLASLTAFLTRYTIPANSMVVGDNFRVTVHGSATNTAGAGRTLQLLVLGGNTPSNFGGMAAGLNIGAGGTQPFFFQYDYKVISIGAAGSVEVQGVGMVGANISLIDNTAVISSVNTTLTQLLGVYGLGSGTGINATIREFMVEKI